MTSLVSSSFKRPVLRSIMTSSTDLQAARKTVNICRQPCVCHVANRCVCFRLIRIMTMAGVVYCRKKYFLPWFSNRSLKPAWIASRRASRTRITNVLLSWWRWRHTQVTALYVSCLNVNFVVNINFRFEWVPNFCVARLNWTLCSNGVGYSLIICRLMSYSMHFIVTKQYVSAR